MNNLKVTYWTGEQIVNAIIEGGTSRDLAIKHLYIELDWQHLAINHALNNNGTPEEADDLAQNAIISLDRNIRERKFGGDSSLKTYFFSIVKLQWLKTLRDRKTTSSIVTIDNKLVENHTVEDYYIKKEKKALFAQLTGQMGKRCQKILTLWQLDYSMEEIAKQSGLSSADMAKKEAYRCRKRLKKFLSENPSWINLLK